jgi:hypothetical protein
MVIFSAAFLLVGGFPQTRGFGSFLGRVLFIAGSMSLAWNLYAKYLGGSSVRNTEVDLYTEVLKQMASEKANVLNRLPDPTPASVTSAASAPVAPPSRAAGL